MTDYWINEVDGIVHAKILNYMNALEPELFPRLTARHLADGFWWFAQIEDGTVIGFAGMVPMVPFDGTGYLKRAYVLPDHRGAGLQMQFLRLREIKAREVKWRKLISECAADNGPSQNNFIKAGFDRVEPEQCWGAPGSVYFAKRV